MQEAIELFDEISGSEWFNKTWIIIFLNKYDLFEVMLKKYPLTVCFESYNKGPLAASGMLCYYVITVYCIVCL